MLAPVALHADEVPVDEDVVGKLLRAQRPDLADMVISDVGGGTDNTIYRIGGDHVARFPRTLEKVAPLQKELTWLPRLRPHLTHLIPTPVHAGRPGHGYPLPWAVFTWIDGEDMAARAVTDWARYGEELAQFVESLHSTDLMGATRSGQLD
jgi:aminoglycoside phosphotransferase (APT) family kinase protein